MASTQPPHERIAAYQKRAKDLQIKLEQVSAALAKAVSKSAAGTTGSGKAVHEKLAACDHDAKEAKAKIGLLVASFST